MFEPPKSYSEMLPRLNMATFFTSYIFYTALVIFNYLPVISIDAKNIPPIKDYEDLIKWVLNYGLIPLLASLFWAVMSAALDLHNNVAKMIRLRHYWEKLLIIKPLAKVAGVNRSLTDEETYKVMSKFYYPEVRLIEDKHYIELFWNKVFYFWILFEQATVSVLTILFITACKKSDMFAVSGRLYFLWIWVAVIVIFNIIVFIMAVKPRTESQVRQIPDAKVISFFANNNIN